QNSPLVDYAEPNFVATASFTPNDPYYPYQWHLTNSTCGGIHAGEAWDTTGGTGAIVAVLDTGVAYEEYSDSTGSYYVAPDLAQTQFVSGYDFVNNDAHANDDHSHGTHVAGTIAQSTHNSQGVAALIASQGVTDPVEVRDVLQSSAEDKGATDSPLHQKLGLAWRPKRGSFGCSVTLAGVRIGRSDRPRINGLSDSAG
ncbi:MAG: S8 family serine peptidase, partial [Planctomycetota bacterium]